MNHGIQDTLRDSALFFENEAYDKDYIEPLYTLYGDAEMQCKRLWILKFTLYTICEEVC